LIGFAGGLRRSELVGLPFCPKSNDFGVEPADDNSKSPRMQPIQLWDRGQMKQIDLVCLCDVYDLKTLFAEPFTAHPWINLVQPSEVEDPEAIRHALVFVPGRTAFDPYPNLKLVCSAGAGVDGILANPSLGDGVAVTRSIIRAQAEAIAGFAIWYIVGWQREMWGYAALQAAGEWHCINTTPPTDFPVGILGYGSIGRTLAAALVALGFPVTGYASEKRQDGSVSVVSGATGLAEIARTSRAIVNVLPLTAETEGVLSADFFATMREDSILINLGRGKHLVEEDLVAALDAGRPRVAALDVFDSEPLPPEHPFWRHAKIMVTPHVSGEAAHGEISDWIAEAIAQFERGGTPQGLVSRARGY
jgi:glyoxylate/hydroxypyruvate reductase A